MNQLPFEKIKRKILVKKESASDEAYGSMPENRPVAELLNCGIVNIDKPSGPTSHQVSEYVQRILGITKAGHSGTLDPGVTGVLPIGLGRATRLMDTLLHSGKEYVALMHLHKLVDDEKLRKKLKGFVGTIKQKPPVRSSVKRVLRQREIYYLEVIEIDGKDVLFQVGCEAGTYIRKLCHDIGRELGCGAHMAELRRTRVAHFDESTLTTLQDLADAFWYYKNGNNKNGNNEKFIRHCIFPMEYAIHHLQKLWVFDSAVNPLCHGRDLAVPGISKLESSIEKNDTVAVLSLKNELISTGKALMAADEIIDNKKGIAVDTEKVFMDPKIYPKG